MFLYINLLLKIFLASNVNKIYLTRSKNKYTKKTIFIVFLKEFNEMKYKIKDKPAKYLDMGLQSLTKVNYIVS